MVIEVLPVTQAHDDTDFSESDFMIKNWTLLNFNRGTLITKFDINFTNPLKISQSGQKDDV